MFRAMTLWMLDHDVDVDDPDAVAARPTEPVIASGTDPADPDDHPRRGRRGRGDPLAGGHRRGVARSAPCPRCAPGWSRSSAPIIGDGGIVVEGRDIGSVVAPDAEVKVYLTADPAARAQRRTAEKGAARVDATEADLLRRDAIDSGPRRRAADDGRRRRPPRHHAVTLDEVIDQVVALVRDTARCAASVGTRAGHEDLPRTSTVRAPHTWALRSLARARRGSSTAVRRRAPAPGTGRAGR